MEIFKEVKLINKHGDIAEADKELNNRIVALFFSAKWSPPCREFIPKLVEIYKELKYKRKAPFEVVFISFDKSEDDMKNYMTSFHDNWWAIPYKDPIKEDITTTYKINMVPKLLIISPNGTLITGKGRKEVEDRGIAAFRTWLVGAGISSARVKTPDLTSLDLNEVDAKPMDNQIKNSRTEDADIQFDVN